MPEENQGQKNITEENPVSADPKQEVVESVPIVEETPNPNEAPKEEQITEPQVEQAEVESQQTEIPEATETPKEEIVEKSPQTDTPAEIQNEEISQTEKVEEIQPQPIQQIQNEQSQPTPQTQQPQVVEKVVYQTPPNLIQNLLTKARSKIQERKNNKLNKIIALFESNPEISNSDVQDLLRTTKRSAARYLNILEKQQKIIQVGNAGRGVKYIRKI